MEESFKKKLVRCRQKWVGHMERMGDEILQKELMHRNRKWRGKEGEEDREGRTALRLF